MSFATLLTKDVYQHQNGLKHINIINNDGFSALFVVNTPVFDDSGVAHGVEHMVFRASAAFPQAESLFQLTALTDAKINASTFENTTYFHCQSQCSHTFMLAIKYLLNGLINPVFHANDLKSEIHDGKISGVIYRELIGLEQAAEPSSKIKHQKEFCYGGSSNLIGNLSLEDLNNFHRRYYQMSNITLVTANADIEQISLLISSLPKQKNQDAIDIKANNNKSLDDEQDSKHQKKYSQEINQLIAIYQQWLQDPYYQEIDDYIELYSSNKPQLPDTKALLKNFSKSNLIAPLINLSNTLEKHPVNAQTIKASIEKTPGKNSLPGLFTPLYQQAKMRLDTSSENIVYVSNDDNTLWLTYIDATEQKLASIASYIISSHPVFLAHRCQGQCYATQALTLEDSSYLAIYSAFDISIETRLKKISSNLLTISQDIHFINKSLVLAKIKYCRANQIDINQLNNITPLNISAYLQLLANRTSFQSMSIFMPRDYSLTCQ